MQGEWPMKPQNLPFIPILPDLARGETRGSRANQQLLAGKDISRLVRHLHSLVAPGRQPDGATLTTGGATESPGPAASTRCLQETAQSCHDTAVEMVPTYASPSVRAGP